MWGRMLVTALLTALARGAVEVPDGGPINRLTEEERRSGWVLLFDGRSLQDWRGFGMHGIPEGWSVADGSIHFDGTNTDRDYVALLTREQFEDFELKLEFRLSGGADTGIFFRVTEVDDQEFKVGPELQLLHADLHRYPKLRDLRRAGANYEMHPPEREVKLEPNRWHRLRLRVAGSRVSHWIDGVLVLNYELWSDDWERRIRWSRSDPEWPDITTWVHYGRQRRGHIGLQDHGDPVWFRNIKVRRLEPGGRAGQREVK